MEGNNRNVVAVLVEGSNGNVVVVENNRNVVAVVVEGK